MCVCYDSAHWSVDTECLSILYLRFHLSPIRASIMRQHANLMFVYYKETVYCSLNYFIKICLPMRLLTLHCQNVQYWFVNIKLRDFLHQTSSYVRLGFQHVFLNFSCSSSNYILKREFLNLSSWKQIFCI